MMNTDATFPSTENYILKIKWKTRKKNLSKIKKKKSMQVTFGVQMSSLGFCASSLDILFPFDGEVAIITEVGFRFAL